MEIFNEFVLLFIALGVAGIADYLGVPLPWKWGKKKK